MHAGMRVPFPNTVPNWLTVGRIGAAVPLVLLSQHGFRVAAFVLFAAASISDWFDGFIARRFDQQSAWGQAADPIADKLSCAAAFLAVFELLAGSWATMAPMLVVFFYDAAVVAMRMRRPMVTLPVARVKTALLIAALSVAMVHWTFWVRTPAGLYPIDGGMLMGVLIGLLWMAAALCLVAIFMYLRGGPALSARLQPAE